MAKKLSNELKNFFITAFDEAVEKTIEDGRLPVTALEYVEPDGLSIIEHLEPILEARKGELAGKDRLIFDCFLTSLKQMIRHRKLTMGFTSFVETLTDLIRYIIIWLNSEKGYNLDADVISRRKSLTGELKKILTKSAQIVEKSATPSPPVIRDRFGLRIIIAEDNPDLLLEVVQIVVAILTTPESDYYLGFTKWLQTCTATFGGEEIPREVLLDFLGKYHLELSDEKNYVTFPKESTYQSWQATLTVDATSYSFCGFKFELQVRTWAMHLNAEYGPASHDEYKKLIEELVQGIFEILEYVGGIVLYGGPDYPDLDLDGISNAKPILSRHVSPHVAKKSTTP